MSIKDSLIELYQNGGGADPAVMDSTTLSTGNKSLRCADMCKETSLMMRGQWRTWKQGQ